MHQNDLKMENKPGKMRKKVEKPIDSSIFDAFRSLTKTKPEQIKGTLNLLGILASKGAGEKADKELNYTLKRLIRGLGAASSSSRTGFYTGLVGFLQINRNRTGIDVPAIFDIADKELHVGDKIVGKEDSDALVGHILLCGAIFRSKLLTDASNEDLIRTIDVLIRASKHKTYHTTLACTFFVQFIDELSAERFIETVWPIVRPELQKPWEKQTINTIYLLLTINERFPELIDSKFMEDSLQSTEIFAPISYKHFSRIFLVVGNSISHPAYETFQRFLLTVQKKSLSKYWLTEVDEILSSPNKFQAKFALKCLTKIISSGKFQFKVWSKFITPNFVRMLVAGTSKSKPSTNVDLNDFFYQLATVGEKLPDDRSKIDLLSKFSTTGGGLMLEKFSTQKFVHRIVHTLTGDGVKEIFDIYKSIYLGKSPDNSTEQWTVAERQLSIQMINNLLGKKSIQSELDWRIEQLKFFGNISLFSGADSGKVPKELRQSTKSMFYSSVMVKLPKLKYEKKLLLSLIKHCNDRLTKSNGILSKKSFESWKEMYAEVTSPRDDKKSEQNLIFQILLMHMGLQLFQEPETAEMAIGDLRKCIEKTSGKKAKPTRKELNQLEAEPEWIEVVVDLFLHLLSQNSTGLRNVVNSVFPHLCSHLTLTAVHQILSVLDMRDGKNPLSTADDDIESVDGEDGSDGSDVSDEESDESEADNEGNVTDQLRNAVSTALGSALPETDTESIDLNDMDDKEAERLDVALSAAFQSMKKTTTGGSKKKTKQERTDDTTVMHFRIRVLDLIEIYLTTNPSLLVTLEILLALFTMTEHCTDKEMGPLTIRLNHTLNKLVGLRQFNDTGDVTEDNLRDILINLIDRKENDKLLSKCLIFLINANTFNNDPKTSSMLKCLKEYLKEFLTNRNPTINFNLLRDLFRIRWIGVWWLGEYLIDTGLQLTIRPLRRIQSITLLGILYKCHGFIASDLTNFNSINKSLENGLKKYLNSIQTPDGNLTAKEFNALILLLLDIRKCHQRYPDLKSHLKFDEINETVQEIRSKLQLISIQTYTTYCKLCRIPIVKNNMVDSDKQNGGEKMDVKTKNDKKALKRKNVEQVDNRKEKKLKNVERLKLSSEGFNGFSFANVEMESGDEKDTVEEEENENSNEESESVSDSSRNDGSGDDVEENGD